MVRRRRIETQISHERWLVSYSDFITLLFAFFVVMYSVSQVSETKYRTLSETLDKTFSGRVKEAVQQVTSESPDAPSPNLAQLQELERELEQALAGVVSRGEVQVSGNQEWVEIAMDANTLFASGEAQPSDEARPILAEVAAILAPYDNAISVAGHTDNIPISNQRFDSNWELSAARAVSVVNLLTEAGVAPSQLSAVGYGEHRPVADNNTEEGRAANRRVVLRVARAAAELPQVSPASVVGDARQPDASQQEETQAAVPEEQADEAPAQSEEQSPIIEPVRLPNGDLLFTSDPERERIPPRQGE